MLSDLRVATHMHPDLSASYGRLLVMAPGAADLPTPLKQVCPASLGTGAHFIVHAINLGISSLMHQVQDRLSQK